MDWNFVIILFSILVFLFSYGIYFTSMKTILIFLLIATPLYYFSPQLYKISTSSNFKFIVILGFIISIVLSLGYGGYYIHENRKNINKNWPNYKCKPYILPFAGWAIGPNGTTTANNFMDCVWTLNKSFFDILISPFIKIIKTIIGILSGLTNDIQNIRQMIDYMRESLRDIAVDVYQKIYDSYKRIAFLFRTILNVFDKLFNFFYELFDVLKFTFYTTASLWNGPIGGIAKFFCFVPGSMVKLGNGSELEIEKLMPGDYLYDNNEVISCHQFINNLENIYNYKGVIVSGNHLVNENNKWIKVKNSKYSKITINKYPHIYCLNTLNGKIEVGGIQFTDFNEISEDDIILAKNYNLMLNYLNKNFIKKKYFHKNILYPSGFDSFYKFTSNDGKLVKSSDIKIGNYLKNKNQILGIIKTNKKKSVMYKNYISDQKLSGTSIIKENKNWIPVEESTYWKKIPNNEGSQYIYHFVTSNGYIEDSHGNIFRDYLESHDTYINDMLDRKVEKKINKMEP